MLYQSTHTATSDYMKIEEGCNFSFPSHMHQCFEIIIILQGEMHITVDGKEYTLHKQDALMIFPHQMHSLTSVDSRHLLTIFSPQLIRAYASRHTEHVPENGQFLPDPYLIDTLQRMTASASLIEKKAILYSLCAMYEACATYRMRESDHNDLLGRIFRFVETEFQNDCSLMALSQYVGCEYTRLSRYFKNTVGISYNDYVSHYRLSNACYLMENSDRTIIQCALESGYSNMRSFNRHFITYYGITPTDYKKRLKEPKRD